MKFLTIIALIACLNTPLDSFLFDKRAPSPWFIEHVALQPFDLPPGVSIELGKNEEDILPQEYILIKNKTSTALYISGTAFSMRSDKASTEFIRKIVNEHVYRWEYEWVEELPSSSDYAWLHPKDVRGHAIWLYVYGNEINTDDALIVKLQPLNQFDGNRPKNVKIPDPQKTFVPVFYDKDEIKIPITIFYTLNPDYHPDCFDIIWVSNWIEDHLTFVCFISILIPLLFLTRNYWRRTKP